ncbi:hypothetical protein EDF38_1316 [Frigoribacterium sp. PhB160]|uniref:hypothetical protein n=1 Tax=Frigoribacterium sp. PhB160 TaxID=2485192 RepID=UPI000F4A2BAF|nr:hypothetical protein [Frigoribacterium sp. PhB160]ROS62213.1 hypothetical protein EDF38_1316 [Frigoribacterium sp. PhB160]
MSTVLDLIVIPNTADVITNGRQLISRALLPGFLAASAAFRAETGRPVYVAEGYRSDEEQRRIFVERYYVVDRRTSVLYEGKYWAKHPGVPVAAIPGSTAAKHRLGEALDLWSGIDSSFTSREHLIWVRVAKPHGWDNTGRSFGEPWHQQGTPGLSPASSGAVVIDIPIESEEDDMFKPQLSRNTKTKRVAFFFPDRVVETESEEQIYRLGRGWNVLKAGQAWTDVVNDIDDAEYNATVTEINASRTKTRGEYVKAIAQGVWDHVVAGWNGKQSARNRLAGIDEKAGKR